MLGIPILLALSALIPTSRPMPLDRQAVLPFDFLGLVLSTASIVLFVVATNWASIVYSFGSWQVILLYWLSGICLIAFVYQQANCIFIRPFARLLPEAPSPARQFYVLWALMALSAIVAYVPLFYLPVHLQLVRGKSLLASAVSSLAFTLSQALGAIIGGSAALLGSDCKYWIYIGTAASLVSAAILSKIELNTGMDAITLCLVLLGMGSGSLLKVLEMATYTRPGHSYERFVTYKTMLFAQFFGLVLGFSLAGGLFIHEARSQLAHHFLLIDRLDIVELLKGASGSSAARLD
ncbi:hypothetical protein CDD81_4756 [Ophiocordyceps australis]|uniref:Major facilitator superfamily (MFS) profile domain-containing protein n=1 Tax=Ophiocordyceps australis TaxID=1399860 RepID=A0A2C5YAI5_9HYPO|nr:hypothetical protein CDD81_4756 [Ophiocordyceps australis]